MMQASPRPRPTIHFHAGSGFDDVPFPQAYRKRKRSSNYSSDDETDTHLSKLPTSPIKSNISSPDDSEGDHRLKRPRRTHIEHGMGGMTLQPYISPVSSSGASFVSSSAATSHWSTGDNSVNNTHHVSEPELLEIDEAYMPRDRWEDIITPQVEEVGSPIMSKPLDFEDIKMKGASWFEPEKDRIIITDLDGFEEEDEEGWKPITPPPEPAQYWDDKEKRYKTYEISPEYLLRFGRVPQSVSLQNNSQQNLALVPYCPPIFLPQQPDEVEEPATSPTSSSMTEEPTSVDMDATVPNNVDYGRNVKEADAMDLDE